LKIIRLKKCASTNDEIKSYYNSLPSSISLCLITKHQYNGKGQLGAAWITESGKNLTFSFLFPNLKLPVNESFKINLLVTLKLIQAFQDLGFEKLQFKWPNDLIIQNKKIGGILIENILQSGFIKRCVIGIGININQTNFDQLPQASSLKKTFKRDFEIEPIFQKIIDAFQNFESHLQFANFTHLKEVYHLHLFRLQKPSMFYLDGNFLPGIIRQVNDNGRLQIEFENNQLKDFDVKEIKMIF